MKSIIPGTRQADKLNREATTEAFVYGIALVLSDVLHFGSKRIQRVVTALNEIMSGYAEQDSVMMCEDMQAELQSRGIEFEIKRRK